MVQLNMYSKAGHHGYGAVRTEEGDKKVSSTCDQRPKTNFSCRQTRRQADKGVCAGATQIDPQHSTDIYHTEHALYRTTRHDTTRGSGRHTHAALTRARVT